MSKFAIGEKVDNAADDHEVVRSSPCFRQLRAALGTPLIRKGTARSSFSPRKNWPLTTARPEWRHKN
jgi:hypothetical protein